MSQQVRRVESVFPGADGLSLLHRGWLPEHTERQMLLVHGFGEHSARYDAMGEWFASRGWAVHGYDHRGHGRSEGHRNYVGRFDEYGGDLRRFCERLEADAEGGPRFPVGHSMGALVVAWALVRGGLNVDAAVLSGGAFEVSPDLSRAKTMAATVLSRVLPRVRTDPGFRASDLSRDPEVVRRYETDPLVDTGMTLSLAAAMFAAQRAVAGQGAQVSIPVLGLHGGDDPICPAAGTEAFLAGVATEESGCTVYPGLLHEIFNEPEREHVWQDVLDFAERVQQRLPAGRVRATAAGPT